MRGSDREKKAADLSMLAPAGFEIRPTCVSYALQILGGVLIAPAYLCKRRGQGVSELTPKKALGMPPLRDHAFNATGTLTQSLYRCALGCGLPTKKPARFLACGLFGGNFK